jgi:hypothetical protein
LPTRREARVQPSSAYPVRQAEVVCICLSCQICPLLFKISHVGWCRLSLLHLTSTPSDCACSAIGSLTAGGQSAEGIYRIRPHIRKRGACRQYGAAGLLSTGMAGKSMGCDQPGTSWSNLACPVLSLRVDLRLVRKIGRRLIKSLKSPQTHWLTGKENNEPRPSGRGFRFSAAYPTPSGDSSVPARKSILGQTSAL